MARNSTRLARRIVFAALLGALVPVFGAAAVTVSKELHFAATANVRAEVRDQCQIETRIPEAIAANSDQVELVDGEGTLAVEITAVHAPGGWIFSGPKWVEVKGRLKSEGKTLSFRAKRYSAFDPFSGGTCGILAKISRAIGSDIAQWVGSPTSDAELGDAK
jgi:hypothetical protein